MSRGAAPGERRGGREAGTPNKATKEVKELAKQYTAEAVNALVKVMRDPNAPHVAVVKASEAILDRGHGRPTQHIEAKIGPMDGLTDDELERAIAALGAKLGIGPTGDAGRAGEAPGGEPPEGLSTLH